MQIAAVGEDLSYVEVRIVEMHDQNGYHSLTRSRQAQAFLGAVTHIDAHGCRLVAKRSIRQVS